MAHAQNPVAMATGPPLSFNVDHVEKVGTYGIKWTTPNIHFVHHVENVTTCWIKWITIKLPKAYNLYTMFKMLELVGSSGPPQNIHFVHHVKMTELEISSGPS